jgi:hypothetical protein
MPGPVALLGIPVLASTLGAFFGGIVSWLGQYVTKRVAIIIAVIASLGALTVAFFATLAGLISGLSLIAPPGTTDLIGLVFPSNTGACISIVMTAYVSRWVYDWQVRVVQLKLF